MRKDSKETDKITNLKQLMADRKKKEGAKGSNDASSDSYFRDEYFEEYVNGEVTDNLAVIGRYTYKCSVINREIEGQKIKVSESGSGVYIGVDNTCRSPSTLEYEYQIGKQSGRLKFSVGGGDCTNDKGEVVNGKRVHGNGGVLLEQEGLVELSRKKDLSQDDVLTLIYNLKFRNTLPENLSDFKTFAELKEKIENTPENLEKNIFSLMKLSKGVENKDCIKTVLYDLRNTGNKKFNLQVRDAVRSSIEKMYPRKDRAEFVPLAETKYLGMNPTKAFLEHKGRG